MEKFVKSVNIMDDTILVPCRLMDLKVGDEQDPAASKHNPKNKHSINTVLNSTDLFDMYNMLNNIKGDLIWGGQDHVEEKPAAATNNSSVHLTITKGHIRRPSTVSVASINSSASSISDSESESNENDSGIEENTQVEDGSQLLAKNFKRHLQGLTNSLKQMTEAAQYLTTRYQHDIGSPI